MLLLFGVIAFFYFTISPNEVDFMLKCPLYRTTGLYCPGCGSQRALHHLLHFDFLKAAQNNLLLLVGILGAAYHYGIPIINTYLNKNFKSAFNKNKNILLVLIFFNLFWVLRNIPHYPFTLLAPSS